jgi:hypothetical protein
VRDFSNESAAGRAASGVGSVALESIKPTPNDCVRFDPAAGGADDLPASPSRVFLTVVFSSPALVVVSRFVPLVAEVRDSLSCDAGVDFFTSSPDSTLLVDSGFEADGSAAPGAPSSRAIAFQWSLIISVLLRFTCICLCSCQIVGRQVEPTDREVRFDQKTRGESTPKERLDGASSPVIATPGVLYNAICTLVKAKPAITPPAGILRILSNCGNLAWGFRFCLL